MINAARQRLEWLRAEYGDEDIDFATFGPLVAELEQVKRDFSGLANENLKLREEKEQAELRDMFDREREKYMTEIAHLRSQLDAWGLYRRLRAKVDEIEKVLDTTYSPQLARDKVKLIINEIREGEI